LACSECKSRNYKTTKVPGQVVGLKKFCKQCKTHTLHNETK
jgi:large subunit ribosomal protein L33